MAVSVEEIKKLRERTGAGMMDAKAALEEANGDVEKAAEVLRKKGIAKAGKKADRATGAGLVDAYLHMGRVGAMVEVQCETDFVARTDDFKKFVQDVAMHVAAAAPQYVKPEDIPEDVLAKEKELFAAELKEQGKPADMLDKIVEGKMSKFYSEVCLLNQPYVKNDEQTVGEYLAENIGRLGENMIIARFARFGLGEEE